MITTKVDERVKTITVKIPNGHKVAEHIKDRYELCTGSAEVALTDNIKVVEWVNGVKIQGKFWDTEIKNNFVPQRLVGNLWTWCPTWEGFKATFQVGLKELTESIQSK